jgi:glyoxylase-like metal-dependent hydrolase (beta-lactamase superfamily II)
MVRDGAGWAIVDTGLDTDETKALWERILAQLPADEPITRVICTHSHNDHAGCAGWLTAKLRVPLHMSLGDYFWLRALSAGLDSRAWEMEQFYRHLGFAPAQVDEMLDALAKMRFKSPAPAAYVRLRDGGALTLGEHAWSAVVGEGHAPEHVSLFCADLDVLICGDQLLPRISANVSVSAFEPEADPLGLWLESLDRIGRLPADALVLPSHELPYYGLATRAEQLRAHHEQALDDLVGICREHPGSPYELMQRMFPRRKGMLDDYLAVSECLAHLSYLRKAGRVTRTLRDDGSYYFAA